MVKMDTGKFLNVTDYESTTTIYDAKNGTKPQVIHSSADPLFNKYVVIGALTLFSALFLVAVVYNFLKRAVHSIPDDKCEHFCNHTDDNQNPLKDNEDHRDSLYTSCHLCVDDQELKTVVENLSKDERTLLVKKNCENNRPETCAVPATFATEEINYGSIP